MDQIVKTENEIKYFREEIKEIELKRAKDGSFHPPNFPKEFYDNQIKELNEKIEIRKQFIQAIMRGDTSGQYIFQQETNSQQFCPSNKK